MRARTGSIPWPQTSSEQASRHSAGKRFLIFYRRRSSYGAVYAMKPFTSCSVSSRMGSTRTTCQALPVRCRINASARRARACSETFSNSPLAIKTRFEPCSDDIKTTLAAFGWSWNQSRGVAKMNKRIRATTTSYCQEARAKSQKINRLPRLSWAAGWALAGSVTSLEV